MPVSVRSPSDLPTCTPWSVEGGINTSSPASVVLWSSLRRASTFCAVACMPAPDCLYIRSVMPSLLGLPPSETRE